MTFSGFFGLGKLGIGSLLCKGLQQQEIQFLSMQRVPLHLSRDDLKGMLINKREEMYQLSSWSD